MTKFAGETYEYNFSKFAKTPYKADLPNNDFRVEQCASIALAPNNPLQQYYICRIMRVKSLGKKGMSLMKFSFVNPFLNMTYRSKI